MTNTESKGLAFEKNRLEILVDPFSIEAAHVMNLFAGYLSGLEATYPYKMRSHQPSLNLSEQYATPWILVSDNPCREYLENAWDSGALGILRFKDLVKLDQILSLISCGERFREILPYDRLMTKSERQVLRLEACGYVPDEIAVILRKSLRTTRDNTAMIREKLRARYPNLHIRKAQHLVHYYFGHWWLLEEYTKPNSGTSHVLPEVRFG